MRNETNIEVHACTSGSATGIEAIVAGKRAAFSIERYVRGEDLECEVSMER